MIDEAAAYVNQLAIRAAELRQEERVLVAQAARDKTWLAEHYWQKRWAAEQKLKAARAVLSVLIEDRYV
jgi:hypothetical protein